MSVLDEDRAFDDISFEDPWERLENAAPVLEWIADAEDVEGLVRYRQLVESLEQQIRDGEETR